MGRNERPWDKGAIMSTIKKDYIVIAAAIKASERPASAETAQSLRELSLRLCSIFEVQNPAFDRARFLQACGVVS